MTNSTTPRQFRARIERMIRAANSDAPSLAITWLRCDRCTWADGSQGFSGTVQLDAPGFRPTTRIVTFGAMGWSA